MHRSEFGCRRCGVSAETAAAVGASEASAQARTWKPFALPGAPRRWSRDREFDVRHIRLDIEIDPAARRITGSATHVLRPFLEGLTTAEFDCVELEVSRVTVGGRRARFEHADGKLNVSLPKSVRAGRDLEVSIHYAGSPRRGLYFVAPDEDNPHKRVEAWTQGQDEDSRHWFPCFDYPNEKQTSEILATVPDGFQVLSNGTLRGGRPKRARKGWKTWHWRLDEPHVTYLMMLAVGEYEVHETAWRGVPVTYWSPPGRMTDVKRTLGRTPRMLTLFSKLTGVRYPYPQYAQVFVQDFIFGGMENTSATTLMDTAILDREAAKEVWMDGLVAHELGHQWFGDLVTCRDWSHGWLNEGFASFMEIVWKGASEGADEEAYYRLGDQKAYLTEDARSYRRPIVCNEYFDPIEIFDRHLYQKGACVLHMLKQELGEEVFWRAVGHYLDRHAGGSVVTDDLRRAVEDISGRNLDWFFDQWVFHGGHPELDVQVKQTDGRVAVSVRQRQRVDAMTRLFRFDVGLRVVTDKGVAVSTLEIREAAQTFFVDVKGKLRWIAFDPGAHLLWHGKVEQSGEAWALALAKDPDGATRVRAARALAKIASPAAVKALAAALRKDDCWFVRHECATALGRIRGELARDALLKNTRQEDPRVRRTVATALGEFRNDAKAARALRRMLGPGEKSPGVLHDAALALGRTRDAAAYEALLAQLDRDAWNDMARRGALLGLGALRDDRALDTVIDHTGPDQPGAVQAVAATAMAKLGRDGDGAKERVRERLEELVAEGWLRTKMTSVGALVERRETKSVPVLRRQAEVDLDGRVVRTCKIGASKLTSAATSSDDIRALRKQVEEILDENRKLKDRIEKLEADK